MIHIEIINKRQDERVTFIRKRLKDQQQDILLLFRWICAIQSIRLCKNHGTRPFC